MPPIAILLMNSQSHAVLLPATQNPLAQAAGFLFVLLATSLIIMAMESLRSR